MSATIDAKQQAEAAARKANQRLSQIRDAERYEENKHLAGKTFRSRNSFSCPEKPSDYWWYYSRVQSVDKAGMLTVFTFQIDRYGRHEVKVEKHIYSVYGNQIDPMAFNKAWRDFQKKIAKMAP
jgi:hypothetical protein